MCDVWADHRIPFFVYPGTHRDFHLLCSGKLVLRVGSKFFERVSNQHALFKCRCSSHGSEHVISPEEGGASSPRSFFFWIFFPLYFVASSSFTFQTSLLSFNLRVPSIPYFSRERCSGTVYPPTNSVSLGFAKG